LGFKIREQSSAYLELLVPTAKNDVTRAADVVEEIIRIYGPNRIPMPGAIRVPANLPVYFSSDRIRQSVAECFSAIGLSEAMNNSLTQDRYASIIGGEGAVKVLNPLSSELGIMRTSLVFGLVESLRFNINRKASSVGLFEFGKTYLKRGETNTIKETDRLGIVLAGSINPENWQSTTRESSFYSLKRVLSLLGEKLGLRLELKKVDSEISVFEQEFQVIRGNKVVGVCGPLDRSFLKGMDVDSMVYFAELNWSDLERMVGSVKTQFTEISKFPEVRRDLALLLDKGVAYIDLEKAAFQAERKLLKAVNVFDVYEGKNLPEGKKSYALSFILQDKETTLTDAIIEKVMAKLMETFKSQFGAELR
ncbi:MAG: phenylalanine--tRNA ligase subunit beta, partial [Bacteroidia bacterium]|nr:phenylalanine--tRNA ligase subunit beta [Bacteroidia bacterium]